MTLLHTK